VTDTVATTSPDHPGMSVRQDPDVSPGPTPDAGSWEPDEEAAHAAMVKEYDATLDRVMGASDPLVKAHDEIKRLTALVAF